MAFTISDFIRLRPFVYHLTDRANLLTLARSPMLEPAADLLARAGHTSTIRSRRTTSMSILVDGERIVLKDQKPLIFANAQLAPGWTSGDFVEYLNQHVFFWPGNGRGPVKYGERLFAAYEADGPAILRARTNELIAANSGLEPLFSPFNSGAPRMQRGKRVPRGPNLFAPASTFPRSVGKVVELVFRGAILLPSTTKYRIATGGWKTLGSAATLQGD